MDATDRTDLADDPADSTEVDWREQLTPEQYRVLRGKGTERAFTGAYVDNHDPGHYRCAGCSAVLFRSDAKFDSGTGWPSFTEPDVAAALVVEEDDSFGMKRVEVMCAGCGGHLGHVFEDGPSPEQGGTGLRYCINSVALDFDPAPGA